MEYLFLKKDKLALQRKKEKIQKQMLDAAQDAAVSREQSSESWHDNFGHEEAVRQQRSLGKRLAELHDIEDKMKIVEPAPKTSKVDIGLEVTLQNTETGKEKKIVVGSYFVFDKKSENEISYNAPIIKPFIDKKKGVTRTVEIQGEKHKYKVTDIRTSQ